MPISRGRHAVTYRCTPTHPQSCRQQTIPSSEASSFDEASKTQTRCIVETGSLKHLVVIVEARSHLLMLREQTAHAVTVNMRAHEMLNLQRLLQLQQSEDKTGSHAHDGPMQMQVLDLQSCPIGADPTFRPFGRNVRDANK